MEGIRGEVNYTDLDGKYKATGVGEKGIGGSHLNHRILVKYIKGGVHNIHRHLNVVDLWHRMSDNSLVCLKGVHLLPYYLYLGIGNHTILAAFAQEF